MEELRWEVWEVSVYGFIDWGILLAEHGPLGCEMYDDGARFVLVYFY